MSFKRSVDLRLPFELSWLCHEVGTNRSFMFAWTHWPLAETFIQRFKAAFYGVAFKFRGRLLWGQLPIIGLLPGQSASQCTIGSMLSRPTRNPDMKDTEQNRRLSRTIWILPEEERNLHTLVSAFGIHYCSPQRLIWFTEWNDRRMYVFPTHDPQQY